MGEFVCQFQLTQGVRHHAGRYHSERYVSILDFQGVRMKKGGAKVGNTVKRGTERRVLMKMAREIQYPHPRVLSMNTCGGIRGCPQE